MGSLADPDVEAALAGGPQVGFEAPTPKAKDTASGGLSRRAFVPVRARSGEMTTEDSSPISPRTSRTSSGTRSGRSAGRTSSAEAPRSIAQRRPSSRAGLRPLLSCLSGAAPRFLASPRTIQSGLTTPTFSTPAPRSAATTRPIM